MKNSDFDILKSDGTVRIRLSFLDLAVMLASLIAFTVVGFLSIIEASVAAVIIAPLFAAETRRLGGLFPIIIPAVSAVSAILLAIPSDVSLISLINIPFVAVCSYIIAASSTRHADTFRTSAVFGITVTCVIWFVTFLALVISSLDMSAKHFVRLVFERLDVEILPLFTETMTAAFGEIYSAEECAILAKNYLFSAKIVLPAYYCLAFMAGGYLAVTLYKAFSRLICPKETFDGVNLSVTMSKAAASAYLIATLLSILVSGPARFGMQNVTTILTPGFFILGLRAIRSFLYKKNFESTAGKVLTIVIAIAALSLGNLAISLIVVFGLNYTFSYKGNFEQKGGGKGI